MRDQQLASLPETMSGQHGSPRFQIPNGGLILQHPRAIQSQASQFPLLLPPLCPPLPLSLLSPPINKTKSTQFLM